MERPEFEVKEKDVAARIGKLSVRNKTLETPLLLPVYDPKNPLIPADELVRRFRVKGLMVNAYSLLRSKLREDVEAKGIHRFLGFDGLVMTDSGAFQLMEYGSVLTSNEEILEFQVRIKSDIGSLLDVPTLPYAYKPLAEEQLELTLKRAEVAKRYDLVVNAGIQGSTYLDLRRKATKLIGRDFWFCAIGGIVRLLESYDFSAIVRIIGTVTSNLPRSRVVHAFGLGHPMVFGLAALLGCDVFDSAAYTLYARDLRYMTESGTKRLEELQHLPCSCEVCEKYYEASQLRELPRDELTAELARHNLFTCFEELRRVKQAIVEGRLWELVETRCSSHPKLAEAFLELRRFRKWLAELDPITKRSGLLITSVRTGRFRPEVLNAKRKLKNTKEWKDCVRIPLFGEVPRELLATYPFGTLALPNFSNPAKEVYSSCEELQILRVLMDYQFGEGASKLIGEGVEIKRSPKTGRMRLIYENGELLASIRATDHFIIPKPKLAKELHNFFEEPRLRVVISQDAVPFVAQGRNVFSKFVLNVDEELRARDEVLVVDEEDRLVACGMLTIAPREALEFDRGLAVKVRDTCSV